MSQPFLPSEILLLIVEYVVPSTNPRPIALLPSHPTTKTLLSLSLTSRLIYPTALRLLHAHCLYIDSFRRLQCVVQSLVARDHQARSIQLRSLPSAPLLHHITALYLSPFPTDTINDLHTANLVLSLLTLLASNLRRLVIDIPLRSLYPTDDVAHIRPILRHAFSQLRELEVFCSVRDELFLATVDFPLALVHPPVWSLWPQLRTLALYNPDVSAAHYWEYLGNLRNLRVLALTRSDGLDVIDIKLEWEKYCGEKNRSLSVVVLNVDSQHRKPLESVPWGKQQAFNVRQVNVPISYYGDEDEAELCQQFVKRRMLKGESPEGWA